MNVYLKFFIFTSMILQVVAGPAYGCSAYGDMLVSSRDYNVMHDVLE